MSVDMHRSRSNFVETMASKQSHQFGVASQAEIQVLDDDSVLHGLHNEIRFYVIVWCLAEPKKMGGVKSKKYVNTKSFNFILL